MNYRLLNVMSLTCECVRKVRLSILFHFFRAVYADTYSRSTVDERDKTIKKYETFFPRIATIL